jgi:hypothetical protein
MIIICIIVIIGIVIISNIEVVIRNNIIIIQLVNFFTRIIITMVPFNFGEFKGSFWTSLTFTFGVSQNFEIKLYRR